MEGLLYQPGAGWARAISGGFAVGGERQFLHGQGVFHRRRLGLAVEAGDLGRGLAVSARRSGEMPAMTRRMDCAAQASAMAWPMPLAAPVTRAVLPARVCSMRVLRFMVRLEWAYVMGFASALPILRSCSETLRKR